MQKKKTNLAVSTNTKSSIKKVSNDEIMKYSFGVDESTIGYSIKKFVVKYEN